MVICGATPELDDEPRVDPHRAAGVSRAPASVKRAERPAQISPMSRERAAASAAPPPKKAATAGAAATAIPPRPMHSSTAESPMSSAASSAREALAQERVLDRRGRRA